VDRTDRGAVSHVLLLADDSATIQRVIELTFSGEDVTVITVGDGEQAIARIPVDHPDIILADIGMPKRNGYDVAAFVKGHPDFKHIPVLLLAGAFEPVDQQLAEQVGCNGVLVKPFEPQHVIARVRELLDGAKGTPTQATADVARPVERLAAPPRTLEFPRRDEPKDLPVDADESLDSYFDRLDAAFATLDTPSIAPSGPPPAATALEDRLDVPTLEDVLSPGFTAPSAPIDLPIYTVMPPPVEPPDMTPPVRSLVADAFTALLAVEQGEPGATPVRLTAGTGEPVITEALLDELTRRVIERLSPDAVRDVVAQVVSEVAERLVREEIQRIKSRQ